MLYNGDCLTVMDDLINKNTKVDAIITSPPYNMRLRVHSGVYSKRVEDGSFNIKYAGYTDDLSVEEYFHFQKEFLEKALQLTDLVFYNIQFVTGNKVALMRLLGAFADKIKEIIIWDKVNAQPAMHRGTLNSQFEFVIVFQNSKPYNRSFDDFGFERGTETNIWKIKRESNKITKAGFPRELVYRIIKDFVPNAKIIMDPFMGSGTVGVVAKGLDIDFIGIELDKDTFEKAQDRMNNSVNKKLF